MVAHAGSDLRSALITSGRSFVRNPAQTQWSGVRPLLSVSTVADVGVNTVAVDEDGSDFFRLRDGCGCIL